MSGVNEGNIRRGHILFMSDKLMPVKVESDRFDLKSVLSGNFWYNFTVSVRAVV